MTRAHYKHTPPPPQTNTTTPFIQVPEQHVQMSVAASRLQVSESKQRRSAPARERGERTSLSFHCVLVFYLLFPALVVNRRPPGSSSKKNRRNHSPLSRPAPCLFSPPALSLSLSLSLSLARSSLLFSLHSPFSHSQAEHTAAYLNFLSRLPPRRSPAVVPFKENRKSRRGNFYFDDDDDDDDNASSTSSSGSPSSTSPPPPLLPPPLARHRGRATLVLDLDHTLVRSVALPAGAPLARGSEACAGPGGARAPTRTAFARRPHLAVFLKKAAELFEVVVFTAGSRAYAEPVLDALDPRGELFAWRLYRDACVRVPLSNSLHSSTTATASGASGAKAPGCSAAPLPPTPPSSSVFVVKDLKRLGRPLRRTLLVDNSPTCYAYQVSNGVPVRSWKGGHRDYGECSGGGGGAFASAAPSASFNGGGGDFNSSSSSSSSSSSDSESEDTALLDLLPLLERAAVAPDVRPLIEAAFPAAAAAAAAARAHPSLFACFEEEEDEDEDEAGTKQRSSAFAAACAEAAAAAAEEEEEKAAAAAAADASSDESDATGLAGTRRSSTTATTATEEGSLDLLLAAATSESESDEDDGAAPVSSPHKKRGRERFEEEEEEEPEERASKALRLELFGQAPQAVCC